MNMESEIAAEARAGLERVVLLTGAGSAAGAARL